MLMRTQGPLAWLPAEKACVVSVSSRDFAGSMEAFLELCLREGFRLENVVQLGSRMLTATLRLPLSLTHSLKLVTQTVWKCVTCHIDGRKRAEESELLLRDLDGLCVTYAARAGAAAAGGAEHSEPSHVRVRERVAGRDLRLRFAGGRSRRDRRLYGTMKNRRSASTSFCRHPPPSPFPRRSDARRSTTGCCPVAR